MSPVAAQGTAAAALLPCRAVTLAPSFGQLEACSLGGKSWVEPPSINQSIDQVGEVSSPCSGISDKVLKKRRWKNFQGDEKCLSEKVLFTEEKNAGSVVLRLLLLRLSADL